MLAVTATQTLVLVDLAEREPVPRAGLVAREDPSARRGRSRGVSGARPSVPPERMGAAAWSQPLPSAPSLELYATTAGRAIPRPRYPRDRAR